MTVKKWTKSWVAPCKDCTEREIGCHSKCEKYAEYRAVRDNMIAENLKRGDIAGAARRKNSNIKW